ncbi:neutral/alkaline non-lysosomal ceramidase N-terminal domain-containing protein [Membranihabitans marinus]
MTLFVFFITYSSGQAQSKVFKAGASISNVTPALGGAIIGGWNSPPADYIHDDLNARSVVLDDGETTLAIVVVDNVHIKREVFDAAKAIIENRTGIPYANVMMSSTHTHSGVGAHNTKGNRKGWQVGEPLDEYQRFIARRIADGVQTAYKNLEPAKIGWGGVDVPEHVFNRRWFMTEEVMNPFGGMDKVKMNPGSENLVRPAGPIDPEVAFMAVESKDGKPIALLGNYSLHYVGNVPHGSISADYFAIFADRMQELLNADRQEPRFVGIMSNGTSGDINNINFGGKRVSKPYYEQMNYVANDVAEKVYKAYQEISFQDYVSLGAEQSELTLEVRKATPEILKNMELARARPVDDKPLFHRHEKTYAERIQIIEEEWPDEIDVVMQTFKVGDLGIAAIPFEVFAEIGLEIKEKSPFDQTFTLGLANGIYGYLPTPEQHKLGGYETWLGTNRVEYNASRKIVSELLSLFSKLD